MLSKGTNHKEILCFFSTESQCDLQVSSHPNNQICEEHVEKRLLVALSAGPIVCFPQLSICHEVSTCHKSKDLLTFKNLGKESIP